MAKSNVTKLLREERHLAKKAAAAEPEYSLNEQQWAYFKQLADQKQAHDALIENAIIAAGLPRTAVVNPYTRTVEVPSEPEA